MIFGGLNNALYSLVFDLKEVKVKILTLVGMTEAFACSSYFCGATL